MSMRAPVRTEFETTDPEQAHEMITTAYADNKLKITGAVEGFKFEQRRLDLGDVRVDDYHTTLTTEYHLEPFGHVLIARIVDGVIDNVTGGVERRLGPGDVYLPGRPHEAQFTRLQGARVELTSVELPLLSEVDPDGYAARLGALRLEPLDPGATRRWQQSVRYVTRLVAGNDPALSPIMLGAAGRLLAATVFDTFAPDTETVSARDRRDATPAAVQRAVDFLEANADLDIGPADAARAAFVGVRALQLAFRRHLDTTPMAYLRRTRLTRAHHDLVDAHPGSGVTVTLIAGRWGFANPTRFAAHYQSEYGCPPSRTLRER